jgi:phosphoribosyl-ATP pyrophosphohydrolase
MRQSGEHAEVVALHEREDPQALRQKLVEEAREAAMASEGDFVTEQADLYEVLQALMSTSGISEEAVRLVQTRRRTERGGCTLRLFLLWTSILPSET